MRSGLGNVGQTVGGRGLLRLPEPAQMLPRGLYTLRMLIHVFRREQPSAPRSGALVFQHPDLDRTSDTAGIEPDGVLAGRGDGELAFGHGGRPFRPKDVA